MEFSRKKEITEQALDSCEFDLLELDDGYSLIDMQGANLGNIESEKFNNMGEILYRIYYTYIEGHFSREFVNQLQEIILEDTNIDIYKDINLDEYFDNEDEPKSSIKKRGINVLEKIERSEILEHLEKETDDIKRKWGSKYDILMLVKNFVNRNGIFTKIPNGEQDFLNHLFLNDVVEPEKLNIFDKELMKLKKLSYITNEFYKDLMNDDIIEPQDLLEFHKGCIVYNANYLDFAILDKELYKLAIENNLKEDSTIAKNYLEKLRNKDKSLDQDNDVLSDYNDIEGKSIRITENNFNKRLFNYLNKELEPIRKFLLNKEYEHVNLLMFDMIYKGLEERDLFEFDIFKEFKEHVNVFFDSISFELYRDFYERNFNILNKELHLLCLEKHPKLLEFEKTIDKDLYNHAIENGLEPEEKIALNYKNKLINQQYERSYEQDFEM